MKSQNVNYQVGSILLFVTMLALMVLNGSAQAQIPADPFNYSRASGFSYDQINGMLTSETVEPQNPDLCVTTTYSYDAYGNKLGAQTANCDGASDAALFETRSSSILYEAQTVTINGVTVTVPAGSFPTTVTNALNQTEHKIVDPRFGKVTSLTGPNGLTTSWQIDIFGRTVRETRADNTSTVFYYCYISGRVKDLSSNTAGCPSPTANEIPVDAVSFMHSESRNTSDIKNGPFSRSYVDGDGRKLRTVSEAYDGDTQPGGTNRLIAQDVDYTGTGVAEVATQPYFLDTQTSTSGSSGGYGMTDTKYDTLGRPVQIFVTDPAGSQASIQFGNRGNWQASVRQIAYDGLISTTINDKNQRLVEEKNVDGKLTRITDALGAQIAHQYDAFGNLIQTKDALQNMINISFDIRGRKLILDDPDKGRWTYVYNALGELVQQYSPQQQTLTTMKYDLLGRMTQRVELEYTSNWYFDTYASGDVCNSGIGKLCETITTNGINRKMVYDDFGRLINSLTAISNGPSFASAISYDAANGRVNSQTYPTGFSVNYVYTGKGYLSALTLGTLANIKARPDSAGGTPDTQVLQPVGTMLWQALAYNAWSKPEQQTYGNNVISQTDYDAVTGRVNGQTAGIAGSGTVTDMKYAWDSLNHLVGRSDANGDGTSGAVTDSLAYDSIGRLQNYSVASPSIPSLQRDVTIQYNALGSILFKSDVGIYSYPTQAGTQPHALQNISGTFNSTYSYDVKGNLIDADGARYRNISYTSFNMPDSQKGMTGSDGSTQYSWQYDESHQRIKETRVYLNDRITTWMLHPDNAGGLSFESEVTDGETFNRHFLSVGGNSIGVVVSTGALPVLSANQTAPDILDSIGLIKVEYWHKDHLGSLLATTDHNGAVTARYSYDPFGKRRIANGNYDEYGEVIVTWGINVNYGTARGYTGHEHLDDIGVIHMNGRLYDPLVGRFMQGDSYIQDPANLQNYNRYGYCSNNPMTCTDPSGQIFLLDDVIAAAVALVTIWTAEKANIIDARTARSFTGIIVSAFLAPAASAQFSLGSMSQAATAGFVGGAISSGTMKGALVGAFTAGAFYGVGQAIPASEYMTSSGGITSGSKFAEAIAFHGVVGCVGSVMGGRKCGPGALSASFSKMMMPVTGPMGSSNPAAGVFVSSVAGGTASVLGGGKFANGAETAAFGYLFNYCSRKGCWTTSEERALVDQGDFKGYYTKACGGGDLNACRFYGIATGEEPGPAARLRHDLLAQGYSFDQTDILVTQTIPTNLAKEYADYLPQSEDLASFPVALDIAKYHWDEFDKYNLPPSTFGGTPFGKGFGVVLPKLWCPLCSH